MGKALDGVRILDFTHVQSGPTCTQLLAWLGADVVKVERAGEGDITRGQLRDIRDVDSLYFTMLNHNKRSITIDAKNPKGKKVLAAMQDGVLNLCRVKLRDQQRLARTGVMEEYPQYPNGKFGDAVPRAGNASGGGQPGWILKCKGWETDPNAYIYFITQAPVWKDICEVIGRPEWLTDPRYATPKARLPHLMEIFGEIEEWTKTKTKFEAMDMLNKHDIPCGPILSMKEIADEPSLRKTGTVVEVDHPKRGKYLTVGNPIKMSDSPTEVTRSPLLGEHTEEILAELGYTKEQISVLRTENAI